VSLVGSSQSPPDTSGRFVQFPGYIQVVVSCDRQLFPFAGMFPQQERLSVVLAGPPYLAESEVVDAHRVVAHGKIRIKLDGALMVRRGCDGAFFAVGLLSKAVRFQSFERGCGGLFERNVKLVHRSQRFAQLRAQLGRRLAQRVQHFLFGRRRHLLLGQRVSALAIHRLQSQHVLAAQTGNRPGKVSLAARPLAKLAGHLWCEFRARRTRHHLQGRRDLVLREHIQNGDWLRATPSACLSVSSNTASPVLLAKSASTMVSFSVRRCVVWRERK